MTSRSRSRSQRHDRRSDTRRVVARNAESFLSAEKRLHAFDHVHDRTIEERGRWQLVDPLHAGWIDRRQIPQRLCTHATALRRLWWPSVVGHAMRENVI